MSLATLAGASVTRCRVQVPAWGCWWADVDLAEPEALAGRVSLVLAGQAMSGTIISGGAFDGRAAYRLMGGAGGWGKELPAKPYNDAGGVRLKTVLTDAASEVGEALADVPASALGQHYARQADASASLVLNELAPRNWYVDFAGVTRIGQRPASTYTGSAPRVRVDLAAQVVDLAVDSIEGLVPGVQVDGSLPATDIEFDLTPQRLTARVYAGRRRSRRLEALAKILELLDPRARYRATYEFRVVTQSGERLNLQPVRVASRMPDLAKVPVRPGIAGAKAQVTPGELVLVCFADGDPSRPQVISHDAADAPGWMPLSLELGGPGALGIARIGDTVQAGPYAGVITSASARIKASL